MAEQQAKVRSVDAIEAFRSQLILFLSKAKPTLEEAVGELTRTRLWVENEQKSYWQREVKTRKQKLEQAQSELFSARLSRIEKPSAAQQMAVHRAQRAIHEAEDKLRVLKKWERELETRTEPMVKLIEQLHGYLTTDMGKAVALLGEIIKTLQAYAEMGPMGGGRSNAVVEQGTGIELGEGGEQITSTETPVENDTEGLK
jgi:hypothetical protein